MALVKWRLHALGEICSLDSMFLLDFQSVNSDENNKHDDSGDGDCDADVADNHLNLSILGRYHNASLSLKNAQEFPFELLPCHSEFPIWICAGPPFL